MTPYSTPCSLCSAAASLRADLRELPTSARASGRPVASSRDRENQQCSASKSLLVFLLCSAEKNFPCPALPGAAGLKNMGPSARAKALRVLHCSACLRRLPAGSRRPAGAVPQAPSARRRREIFGGGAGGGRFRGQRGGQGRNITFLVSPGITRSRQDASIECHIGGSIRPSSGCNGVHFALLNPLFFLSLRRTGSAGLAAAAMTMQPYDAARRLVVPALLPLSRNIESVSQC